ncbi:MAG: class I SAM-dependent methyltransferase [Actinomycetota bacterium]
MTNEERAWWSPEVLAEREREVRSGTSADADDVRNDFASYRALQGGGDVESSGLHLHNEVEPWRIDIVCRDYQAIVRRVLGGAPRSVADLGCGAGFTSDGMHRRWPNATVRGFDVSHDAVQFARHRWKGCSFIEGAIVPGAILEGAPYDFILCQEFYPFTRTDVVESHREWMRLLVDNLNLDGLAIIMVTASTAESINRTYEQLRTEFLLQRIRIGAPRIARRLSFGPARLAGELLRGVKPTWVRNLYVLQRQ